MHKLFIFSLILLSCTNDPKLVQEFIVDEEQAIELIEGAEIIHTEQGKVKVKIIAGVIERFQNVEPQLLFSNHLKVYFYNDSTVLESVLMADNASINKKKKLMTARDNVVLISKKGKKLETEELIWDEVADKIYTNKKVKITTGKEIIHGEGFESTSDFNSYSISKIHGTFSFESPSE